jgi:hypothetical protein
VDNGTINVGVAAHISAAAAGGPRYDPTLSPEQRSDISNAIWLCQNCAKLVDNDPQYYTIEVLRLWKSLAEAVARTEVGKTLAPRPIEVREKEGERYALTRRAELAERVLANFHEARDIIMAARSPHLFTGEGETRPKAAGESQGRTRRLNGYYAVAERLAKRQDFFSKFAAQRYPVVAIFGSESAKGFDELFRIMNEINIAVRLLVEMDGPFDYLPSSERQNLEAKIGWWTALDGDAISIRLDQIIGNVEKVFRPAIQATPLL